MVAVMMVLVVTVVVLAFTLDPVVRRCEFCEGPITLKELWTHMKKCPECPKSKQAKKA